MKQNEVEQPGSTIEWHEDDMPYSRIFGDHFYSRADGRAECDHVFVRGNRLPERWQGRRQFTVAELGFGTGLNYCETWRQWRESRPADGRLLFVSFEKHPLAGSDIDRALGVWPQLSDFREQLIAHWSSATSEFVRIDFDDTIALELHIGEAHVCLSHWRDEADAWFLDGFAPDRNEAMWSKKLMAQVFDHTAPGGTFATYTAAGWVRRNLQAAGFSISKQPGYAGKRDMTVGTRA